MQTALTDSHPHRLPFIAAAALACLCASSASAQLCFGPTPYAVGAQPSCVVMSDLNNDGALDLAVANHALALDNRMSVLLNNGDGTFAPSVFYDTDDLPYWIAVGDLDGDGDQDLAVTNNFGENVSIFINVGAGAFAPQVTYAAGAGAGPIAMVRLDADADLDLAIANLTNDTVSVLMNNGDATFARQVVYDVGDGPYGITSLDIDNDGAADLAIANYSYGAPSTVSLLQNIGDGTFAPQILYSVAQGPVGIASSDLNADGWHDLAVACEDAGAISILLNNGDGTFGAFSPYLTSAAPYGICLADFNSDGYDDVAAAGETGVLSLLMNQGDGTLGPTANTDLGIALLGLDAGDLDGNGTLELAVTGYGGSDVLVLVNQSPAIVSNPAGGSFALGGPITLTAAAAGDPPLTYRWQRNGVDMVDDSRISGSATDTLTIDPAIFDDAADYALAVTNDCGTVVSAAATIVVFDPCPADIAPIPDGNGVVDVDDLVAVILGWGACADCLACPADVRDTPTTGDCVVNVDDLVAVILAWGECP